MAFKRIVLDEDIRQTDGFKNVSLGNVIPASYQYTFTPFLNESDARLLKQWRVSAFELQVNNLKFFYSIQIAKTQESSLCLILCYKIHLDGAPRVTGAWLR